jgi:hypothetical protein
MREQEWLASTDACILLSVSYPVMYRLICTGRLKARRKGGRWEIEVASIKAYRRAVRSGQSVAVAAST